MSTIQRHDIEIRNGHYGGIVWPTGLSGSGNYDAIHHLILESTMCEAAIEDFFSEANIKPLTVVRGFYSDDVAEQWVQRYREESQKGWENRRW